MLQRYHSLSVSVHLLCINWPILKVKSQPRELRRQRVYVWVYHHTRPSHLKKSHNKAWETHISCRSVCSKTEVPRCSCCSVQKVRHSLQSSFQSCMLTFGHCKAASYKAIFVSVDVPVLGRRLNEMRNSFTLPEEMQFPNLLSNGRKEFSGDNAATAFGMDLGT